MLRNKKFNIVLALLIAIALWAYVLGDVNPESSKTMRNVPITFINQAALEETGLTLLSSTEVSVNISISGQRTAITKTENDDFTVTADLEGLNKGQHTIRLSVSAPDDIKITHMSVEKITVEIDDLAVAEKNIEVVINGQTEEDKEPDITETSLDTVKITGAKTLVDKVDKVKATIEVGDIGEEASAIETELMPVDENGTQISGIRLDHSKVLITAVMLSKKTVELEVPVKGENEGGVERSVSVPEKVVIKGKNDVITDIDKITCNTLDVSDIYESVTIDIEPILPEGVKLGTDSSKLSAEITVKAMSEKTFNMSQDNIILTGENDSFEYIIDEVNFTVDVAGKEDIISNMSEEDIEVSADVSGLTAGVHSVDLTVKCSKETYSTEISVEKVRINIEQK